VTGTTLMMVWPSISTTSSARLDMAASSDPSSQGYASPLKEP
jgi:hypothetical protein